MKTGLLRADRWIRGLPTPSLPGYFLRVPTVAEQLRQAREAMRLDIQQVAETTKLKTDHVRALEEGDYAAFTAPIYLRGSLRTYARLLKLDTQKLLTQLDSELGDSGMAEEPSLAPPRPKSGLDSVMLLLSRINWVVAAVVIVVVLLFLAGNAGYRAWRSHKTTDPLKKLGPGLYEPATNSGETLPLPTNTLRK